jgi:O-antigen ligase
VTSQIWSEPAPATRTRGIEIAAFAFSVFIFLTYSEIWVSPLIGDKVDEASSALVRNLYFPAYFAGLFLLALRPGESLMGMARQPFLLALLAIAGASTLWSVAPDQTFRREVALVFTTLSGVIIGVRWRWPTLVEAIATAFAVLAILSLFAGLALPDVGRMEDIFPGAWRGFWPEKNTFGGMMVFALLAFAAAALLRPRRAPLWWSMAALAVLLILLSTSKTSLVALGLGVAALGFVLLVRRGGAISVVAVYAGVIGAAGLAAAIMLAPDVFLALLGKDATLTGRTKIWEAILRLIHQRPWLGYGYAAVWSDTSGQGPLAWIVKQAGYKPDHAHNGWLEQWLGMGLLGLAAWALCFLTAFIQSLWSVFSRRGALFAFPIMVVYALMILSESIALAYNDLRWVLFVIVAARLSTPEREPGLDDIRIERRAIEPQGQIAQPQRGAFSEPQRSKHWPPDPL